MWITFLPMMLLALLVPFLLLAQEIKVEQSKTKVAHLAQMVQIYNQASVRSLSSKAISNGTRWVGDVKSFIPPNIRNGQFWQQQFDSGHYPIDSAYDKSGNTCLVVSFLRTNTQVSLQDKAVRGMFTRYWSDNGVTQTGLYRFNLGGFVDSTTGKVIQLNKFSTLLNSEDDGVPIMLSRIGC